MTRAATPEPSPAGEPKWFAHQSSPRVFHVEASSPNRPRHAACATSIRMRPTQTGVRSAEVSASGIRCRFCLDVISDTTAREATAVVDEATVSVTTLETVGMTTVGSWFGYSKAAVSNWRKHYPNTPKPDVMHEGSPGWLPSRKAEWLRWHKTEGPGRPSHEKRKHLRVAEDADPLVLNGERKK